MSEQQVRDAVLERYDAVARGFDASCCDDDCGCNSNLYEADLASLPADVTGLSLGCGDPITLAALQPGQTVLDLGSGGGIDCFLAAQRVGADGYVIGVDMTPSMLEKANANKAKMGVENVEFRFGQIEQLPVEDAVVDVIISNCVVNLSPNKAAVVDEAFRVLKPGGKFAISDMVTIGHFSAEQRADMKSWSACVAGAEDAATFAQLLRTAGFENVSMRDKGNPNIELGAMVTDLIGQPQLISANITAFKPIDQ